MAKSERRENFESIDKAREFIRKNTSRRGGVNGLRMGVEFKLKWNDDGPACGFSVLTTDSGDNYDVPHFIAEINGRDVDMPWTALCSKTRAFYNPNGGNDEVKTIKGLCDENASYEEILDAVIAAKKEAKFKAERVTGFSTEAKHYRTSITAVDQV